MDGYPTGWHIRHSHTNPDNYEKFGLLQLPRPWLSRVQRRRVEASNLSEAEPEPSAKTRVKVGQGTGLGTCDTTRQGATWFLWRLGFALTLEKNYMQNASEPPRQGPYNPPLWSFITRSVIVTRLFLIQSKEEGTHQVKKLRTGVNISCTQIWLRLKNLHVRAWVLSHVWLFVTPWTVAHQASLSMDILQARTLEWVAMPSFGRSSQPRDQSQVSCTAGRFFTVWATRGAPQIVVGDVYHISFKAVSHTFSPVI